MADRHQTRPKSEGTLSSSVEQSERVNKSRSPIITRSRSRGGDEVPENSATRRSKRTVNNNTIENSSQIQPKKPKVDTNTVQAKKPKPKASTSQDPIASSSSSTLASSSSSFLSQKTLAPNKKQKKETEEKKTGSSLGTSKNLATSKSSKASSKQLTKSASLEENSEARQAKSLVMDQNGANSSNNNAPSSSAANPNTSGTSSNVPTSSSDIATTGSAANPTGGPGNLLASSNNSTFAVSAQLDAESDDSDMSRLQTILESRGLHPHFLGLPRMQNFFYRSLNSTSNSKAQQLLQALNSTTNDAEKLNYVLEMCQLLLMGNEDTLVGFPIKTVVPTLINLLSMEHNFEIMHHACRALTYMMEALPRSSVVVLDAVPVFLEKLQVIQCMDVAEQSLSALEMLSRRHNKAILQARGVSACLTYLDFFSIDAQRSALTITANCFQNITTDDFQYVQDSLPILSSHLSIEDKKCIESICLAFSRLVDCYQQDCAIISEIASSELLTNIQSVLMTVPPILSTGSFVNVIRMLSIMCSSCSQISVELLKLDICSTLKCLLLCNNSAVESGNAINLISRSPQEIYELTAFIAELMPSLPSDGIFAVDQLFTKANQGLAEVAQWQWKDDRGLWHPFNVVDNKIIESAHHAGEDELELASLNRTYIIDFNSMQKIYEDTGNSYAIQRKVNTLSNSELASRPGLSNVQNVDPRSEFIYNEQELSCSYLMFIFSVLNEVYNNSAGFSVRYKCLNAILRIIYHTPKDLLYSILKDQSMSSSIATMLASSDIRIVVCATQMCNILMEKMPEVFSTYFQREGVIHQIRKLYSEESRFTMSTEKPIEPLPESKHSSTIVFSNSHQLILDNAHLFLSNRHVASDSFSQIEYIAPNSISSSLVAAAAAAAAAASTPASAPVPKTSNPARQNSAPDQTARSDDILKRKRTKKNFGLSSGTRSSSLNSGFDHTPIISPAAENGGGNVEQQSSSSSVAVNPPVAADVAQSNNNNAVSNGGSSKGGSTRLTSKDFLQRLNPSRWTRWTQNSLAQNTTNTTSAPTTSTTTPSAKNPPLQQKSSHLNKEKIKAWIKSQAKLFDDKYFLKVDKETKTQSVSCNVLDDLTESINSLGTDVTKALLTIKQILLETDLSSFELIHSGLVKNLLSFLVGADFSEDVRDQNLRSFLNIFYGAPLNDIIESIDEQKFDPKPLSILINKLNACVSQLEQFPLRVHDYANSRGGSHAKFLSSHHIKVSLSRHSSCSNIKKYKGPLIKLDPFTPVQSIERFLLARGYGKIKDVDDDQSDDDISDEDLIDNITNFGSASQAQGRHRLQLLINDQVLPYNYSIFQAIKQFMISDHPDTDSDDPQVGAAKNMSNHTFNIQYRLATESAPVASANASSTSSSSSNKSSRKTKSSKSATKKKDEIWLEGKTAKAISPLESYLKSSLSFTTPINDQSIEVLCLLRVLFGINRYWGYLYKVPHSYNPAIPLKEFINYKLTVKANRQLQDPVVIMAESLPNWLSEIANACPFIFPFDTRYLLFYVVCFDRERALQRLLENTPDFSSLDSRERSIVPRLEKRKRIVSRADIFKSAEALFNDLSGSKSLLEIQYENEVGTGLGPTLEFYALVSKEFQRSDFEMWRGEVLANCEFKQEKNDANPVNYVFSSNGLFPAPLGRSTKPAVVNKLKQRFKLLGKFMAKALMDSRMIDIPLNILFYKWLLNEQPTMNVADIQQLDPTFSTSIFQMYKILLRKSKMNLNNNDDSLKLHGCSIDDLNLDFTLPGYSSIEMRKGGRDMLVTVLNLDNYINLVTSWLLIEGVLKQMEAFKEGFNSVFNSSHLRLFYPEEMQQLFCGASYNRWDVKMLMESCKTDHGFSHDSKAIHNLFEILSSYNAEEQRKFLQFLTGSPRLPIGGFKSLIPPFTIVRKTNTTESDNPNCLPSVMTCVNYLKLPDYPTIEIMREKLKIAINEGQFSFHLS